MTDAKIQEQDIINNAKLIEFIYDLNQAIKNGHFSKQENSDESRDVSCTLRQNDSNSQLNNLINVKNLSNSTYTYIISWLKNQQRVQQSYDATKVRNYCYFLYFFIILR